MKSSWVTSALSSDSRLTDQSGLLLWLGLLRDEMQVALTSQLQHSNQTWRMTNTSFLPPQEGHSPASAHGGDWQPPAQGACRRTGEVWQGEGDVHLPGLEMSHMSNLSSGDHSQLDVLHSRRGIRRSA